MRRVTILLLAIVGLSLGDKRSACETAGGQFFSDAAVCFLAPNNQQYHLPDAYAHCAANRLPEFSRSSLPSPVSYEMYGAIRQATPGLYQNYWLAAAPNGGDKGGGSGWDWDDGSGTSLGTVGAIPSLLNASKLTSGGSDMLYYRPTGGGIVGNDIMWQSHVVCQMDDGFVASAASSPTAACESMGGRIFGSVCLDEVQTDFNLQQQEQDNKAGGRAACAANAHPLFAQHDYPAVDSAAMLDFIKDEVVSDPSRSILLGANRLTNGCSQTEANCWEWTEEAGAVATGLVSATAAWPPHFAATDLTRNTDALCLDLAAAKVKTVDAWTTCYTVCAYASAEGLAGWLELCSLAKPKCLCACLICTSLSENK